MAKIPKFNLTMDGELVRSIEELQNNFSVDDILDHFESKRLHKWLKTRGLTDYLTKVEAIEYGDKTAIIKPLMDIFEIDYSDEDLSDILDQLKYVPTTASHNALVAVTSAQADIDKFPVAPLSKELSGSVNIDYEVQKYKDLVKEIINDPYNIELIKKNVDLIASKYYGIYSLDALDLFCRLHKHCHLALYAILDNQKAIKPYVPFFLAGQYNAWKAIVEDPDTHEWFYNRFFDITRDVFSEKNIAQNYKFFTHFKYAYDSCITKSPAIVLFATCMDYDSGTSWGYKSFESFTLYLNIKGESRWSTSGYMYYIDLADYDLPQEYLNLI